jgi:DNA-binding NarL/FixJ family response regulator
MGEMSPISVLLVDDHALFRKGVAELLATERDFRLVGEASDGAQALEMARDLMPDVVLMDISMPVMDGLEATRRIKAEIPCVRIVILTVSDGDRSLVEAVGGGAHSYLRKTVEPQLLLETMRAVVCGEAPVTRTMAARLLGAEAGEALTAREREVLGLVAGGKRNNEISVALGVAENVVKNHLKNVLEKLHLERRA